MCCYVTDYVCGDQQKVIFEKPNGYMKVHLKPLFIQAKVDDIGINKVLVDGGAAVYLMPQSLLKKIEKCGTYLKLHNIVMSNYIGKTGFFAWCSLSESHCGICHQTNFIHDSSIKSQLQLDLRKRNVTPRILIQDITPKSFSFSENNTIYIFHQ